MKDFITEGLKEITGMADKARALLYFANDIRERLLPLLPKYWTVTFNAWSNSMSISRTLEKDEKTSAEEFRAVRKIVSQFKGTHWDADAQTTTPAKRGEKPYVISLTQCGYIREEGQYLYYTIRLGSPDMGANCEISVTKKRKTVTEISVTDNCLGLS